MESSALTSSWSGKIRQSKERGTAGVCFAFPHICNNYELTKFLKHAVKNRLCKYNLVLKIYCRPIYVGGALVRMRLTIYGV